MGVDILIGLTNGNTLKQTSASRAPSQPCCVGGDSKRMMRAHTDSGLLFVILSEACTSSCGDALLLL